MNRRVVEASACVKRENNRAAWSGRMPIPESAIVKRTVTVRLSRLSSEASAASGRTPRTPSASRRNARRREEAVLIEHLPLLGVAQYVVGFLNFFEALLGGFVPGVQIGVVPLEGAAPGGGDGLTLARKL